ncbi:MAG: hypothetical protein ABWY05_16745 [Noviherbaspirillum sp.]
MSYILAEMKGHADPKKRMRQLQAATDSALLRLFVKRWMRAKLGDQIDAHQFAWTEAVDWLVRELREATPLSPGATRAPRSPRLASPKVAPAASPAKPAPAARGTLVAAQTVSANSSTRPKVAAPSRSFAGGATTVPAYVLAPPVPLQSGRQAMSRRVQSYLESPTRLTEAPLPASATRRRQRRHAHFPPCSPRPRRPRPPPWITAKQTPPASSRRFGPRPCSIS